mgnify:FL=1
MAIANYAHIPLNHGVIRYIPVDIDITDSDKLWILDFIKQNYPDTSSLKKGVLPPSLTEEILQKICCNCEKALHPNLVTLSVYELNCIISENNKKKEDKELSK